MYIHIFFRAERCWSGKRIKKKNWGIRECSMPRKSFCMPQVCQPWPKGCSKGKAVTSLYRMEEHKGKRKKENRDKGKRESEKREDDLTYRLSQNKGNYQPMQHNIPEE
jgi:hypothetical protein